MSVFQLQAYRVLTSPVEKLMAITDPITVRMLGRIAAGKHDCVLCGAALNLNPESDSSPALVGYWHGKFSEDVNEVGVAACCACALELGDEEVARRIGQVFANEILRDGEATIELVKGGVA
jgi:hypothetical protein